MRRVGKYDVLPYRAQAILERLQNRNEREVHEHDVVFGVVDDVIQLLGKQPRIERVADGADAHDAEPALQVAFGVPGHCCDAVTRLHAFALQRFAHLQRPVAHRGEGGAPDWTLHAARDQFALAVV